MVVVANCDFGSFLEKDKEYNVVTETLTDYVIETDGFCLGFSKDRFRPVQKKSQFELLCDKYGVSDSDREVMISSIISNHYLDALEVDMRKKANDVPVNIFGS